MPRPTGSSPCIVVRGAVDCAPGPPAFSLIKQQQQQPQEAAAFHNMDVSLGARAVAAETAGGRQRCKSPSSSSCNASSSSSSSFTTEGLPACAVPASPLRERAPDVPSGVLTAAAEAPGAAEATGEDGDREIAADGESLRALQLLLSDVLGVLAMLRPAGSSSLPRGVAAAVSRARQAALAALNAGVRQKGDRGSNRSSNTAVAAALTAAANTAGVVLEQRNPQFAFHQFTVLAAASLQQLSPYVTHHLHELLQVLEQRRSLLRVLRSQDSKGRQGESATSADGQTDNLRLLLQVFLAYCPAAMLDSVCDKLAAAYSRALLGEAPPKLQQKTSAAQASEDGFDTQVASSSSLDDLQSTQDAASATALPAADEDAPNSLSRPQGDPVAVSVAALLGQRSFLQRLASSMNWGPIRSLAAAGDAEAVGSSSGVANGGAPQAIDDPDAAAALRRAYSSAACLFDPLGPWLAQQGTPEGFPVAGPSSCSAAAPPASSKQEQRLLVPGPHQPPSSADPTRQAASYLAKEEQQQQAAPGLNGCQAAAKTATAKEGSVAAEGTGFSPTEATADPTEVSSSTSSSSSHLLRALGSLELPPCLLQRAAYSRSASPSVGLRYSSSEETAAEIAHAAATSDAADYLRDTFSEGGFTEGMSGAATEATGNTALCRPTWPLRQREGTGSSGKKRTLLEALSEVPEERGVLLSHRKMDGLSRRKEAFPASVASTAVPGPALAFADLQHLTAGVKTEKSGNGGEEEEDAATRKASFVSFLLSLLPDSGSYGAALGPPVVAGATAALHETGGFVETATANSKSLGCTQTLLDSLQGHLLRYGSEETATEQLQHEATLVGGWGRRSRNSGPPPSSRVGPYGKSEGGPFGQHPSGIGRDSGAAGTLKLELLHHEDAVAGGISGRPSDADPSRVKCRAQHQLSSALRQPSTGAASAEASDLGVELELVGAGTGSGSYSSLAEALGAPDVMLGGSQGRLFRSTISGVVYDKSGQKWTARWSEYGRQHKKTFATAKYGFLHAKKRAEACRLEASRLMREGQGRALAAAARQGPCLLWASSICRVHTGIAQKRRKGRTAAATFTAAGCGAERS